MQHLFDFILDVRTIARINLKLLYCSIYFIIIIIKCIYIAQDREKLQMRWVTVTNGTTTCLFLNVASEMSGVSYEVQQEDCSTPEVLGQRSCGRCSLFWCVKQSIGRSKRIEDAGW